MTRRVNNAQFKRRFVDWLMMRWKLHIFFAKFIHCELCVLYKVVGPIKYQSTRASYGRIIQPKNKAWMRGVVIDAASPRQKSYLKKEWWNTRADWAHYAKCHSALLLQIPSTNSVESWHASLKFKVKKEMQQWSLLRFEYNRIEKPLKQHQNFAQNIFPIQFTGLGCASFLILFKNYV